MIKRSNSHIWAGVGFVLLAIAVAGAGYFGFRAGKSDPSPSPEQQPTQSAGLIAPEPEDPSVAVTESAVAAPTISTAWLVGTWAPMAESTPDRPDVSCETDVAVTFNADGTYEDGGSKGRFKTDGKRITYYKRVTVPDPINDDEQTFQAEPLSSSITSVRAAGANAMYEEDEHLHRCQ